MAKPIPIWNKCSEGYELEHTMRDYCYSCAPFWDDTPYCPTHLHKLSGKGFCSACRKFYNLKAPKEFITTVELRRKYQEAKI